MMTSIRCPRFLTKCGRTYHNCGSLFAFDNVNGKRQFSTGRIVCRKSHYDVLGLTPKATQVDVKAAYYNLSKVYHPDKNEGSADAAEKFRDITDAYEVLGNYKLRRLYDKGMLIWLCILRTTTESNKISISIRKESFIRQERSTEMWKKRSKK